MSVTTFSFSERLAISRTILAYYKQSATDFAAYNPIRFSPTWETQWENAIIGAETVSTDENIVDLGTDRTARVLQIMEDIRQNYQRHIKPFIEDAFEKTQPGLMNAFGINNYSEARIVVPKMLLFLKNLEEKCSAYQVNLAAVGISSAKVGLITQQYNDLLAASIIQNTFIGERAVSTEERNRLFDVMDEFMSQTIRAGKNIYDKTDARYRRYVIYRAVAATPAATNSLTNIEIAPEAQTKVLVGSLNAQSVIDVDNTGITSLTLFVTGSEKDATPTVAAVIPAQTTGMRIFAADICPSAAYQFLLIRNEDTQNKGACSITLLKMVDDN